MRPLLPVLLLAAACSRSGGVDLPFLVQAQAWPAADALFRSDPRWLGADGAYSVDLGGGRTLWLFGNSFVEPDGSGDRRAAFLLPNTIAVQTGRDPSTATIGFFWGEGPAPYFPGIGAEWFWPNHGIRIGDTLTVFAARMRAVPGGAPFAFETVGHVAFRIDDPDADPATWTVRTLDLPAMRFAAPFGAGVTRRDGFVFAYAVEDRPDHRAWLVRWPESAFVAGDLTAPEWRDGAAWIPDAAVAAAPRAVFAESAATFTVSQEPGAPRYVQVQSRGYAGGFDASDVGLRSGADLAGAWTGTAAVFRPAEADIPQAFVNSSLGHPELTGADLVVTYVPNSFDDDDILADDRLLYPRFVRLSFAARE